MITIKPWIKPTIRAISINATKAEPRLRILHQKCTICGYLHEVRVAGYSPESEQLAGSLAISTCPNCGATQEKFEQWFSANPDDAYLFAS